MSRRPDTAALAPARGERVAAYAIVLYVVALVGVPLFALVVAACAQGPSELIASASEPLGRAALLLTLWTSAFTALLDVVLGTATAWVLARYRFPGRSALSALVALPLAIPTLVAGVMLATLYGPDSLVGRTLYAHGVRIVFARPGIVLALAFVTLPLVVRAVEPVLAQLDEAEEEAAVLLGASPLRVFRTVYLPALAPAALSGGVRALARAVGEFGAVSVVAGNLPFRTLTAPVHLCAKVEQGATSSAIAIALVLLLVAIALQAIARGIENRGARRG